MANIWQFRESGLLDQGKASDAFLEAAEGSPLLATLLMNRGINTAEDARSFLQMDTYQPRSGFELPDMQEAVTRITKAINDQESILIYGDFDVDGITGTSILYETLHHHLKATVSFYIPDRATEGHGLNTAALIRLTSARKIKLVITTDTGITNFNEVSLLNGLGVDTIITDHHALPENLPPAIANVNSQRLPSEHPLHPLCGAGVAYKLCKILLSERFPQEKATELADSLLDIVALGTVVDMVPLIQENRYLVYRGLQVLNRRKRPGFNEILDQAGIKRDAPISSETLGFTIGPRLNALGRLERAEPGVKLITGSNQDDIRVIAAHLEYLNKQRRDLCDQTFIEAENHFQRSGGLEGRKAIVLASPDWNPGIIGIVASRLIEQYHVPVFLMVVDKDKKILRCSARSIPGFNLHDELLALQDYFLHFGGHAGAGGFALPQERFESFKKDLYQICDRVITPDMMKPVIAVDTKLSWSQLNPGLIELIERLAPFGMQNPSPKFAIENITVGAQRFMGEDQRHTKLVLLPEKNSTQHTGKAIKKPIDGIIWNFRNRTPFDLSTPYRFVISPSLNTFQGKSRVQLLIEDYQNEQSLSTAQTVPQKKPSAHQASPVDSFHSSPLEPSALEHKQTGQTHQWIDHRNRDEIGLFVSQMIVPLQSDCSIAIFHEGKTPAIPMLDPGLLVNRSDVAPVDELILWDLPPSADVLSNIIQKAKPKVIHLVGGKYQTVPIHAAPKNYLKLILQVFRQSTDRSQNNTHLVDFSALAARLATTESVLRPGVMALEKIGLLTSQLVQPGNTNQLQIQLSLDSGPSDSDISKHMEFLMFQEALVTMGQYRSWLLNSTLDTIRQSVQLSSAYQKAIAEPDIRINARASQHQT